MFRIGSALFIPAYLTVTLYRTFASPSSEGNLIVMLGAYRQVDDAGCATSLRLPARAG